MSARADIFGRSGQGARIGSAAASEFIRELTAGMSHAERLAQVQGLARMLDDRFAVPGTAIRFGWDAILGLVPGLGDALTSVLSLLIVHHAWQTGASPLTLGRMLNNVASISWSAQSPSSAISSTSPSRPTAATRGCSSSISTGRARDRSIVSGTSCEGRAFFLATVSTGCPPCARLLRISLPMWRATAL
jgi:hypothetical protein